MYLATRLVLYLALVAIATGTSAPFERISSNFAPEDTTSILLHYADGSNMSAGDTPSDFSDGASLVTAILAADEEAIDELTALREALMHASHRTAVIRGSILIVVFVLVGVLFYFGIRALVKSSAQTYAVKLPSDIIQGRVDSARKTAQERKRNLRLRAERRITMGIQEGLDDMGDSTVIPPMNFTNSRDAPLTVLKSGSSRRQDGRDDIHDAPRSGILQGVDSRSEHKRSQKTFSAKPREFEALVSTLVE